MKHHRSIATLGKKSLLFISLVAAQYAFADFAFVHPGLLQSREDLERMKVAVARKEEPIYSGYEVFCTNAESELSYKMRGPLPRVGRNPSVGTIAYDLDANAAYQCAIQWCITGNRAYADKSEKIIDAWSSTLKSITGRDAVLMAGLGPFKMVNAAEILRYTNAGWSPAEIQQAEKNFRDVVYPVIKNFAPFANGNWDTACIKTMMAIGVFCNDRPMFERALRYYEDGTGDGCLTHYIINDTGQCQESGRDQQHTQLGLAHMGDCCEIAWHQGLNLYGYDHNLLLNGFEYTAKYNLGKNVPFVTDLDRTGKYLHTRISSKGRGSFRAVWEEIYNAYVNRMGAPAPLIKEVVEKNRPEGVAVPGQPLGADDVGFGTLLFAQPPASAKPVQIHAAPASPGGLIANGSLKAAKLTWIASVGTRSYTIKRALKNGDYKAIAHSVLRTTYTDTHLKTGEVYRYVVCAVNSYGKSPDSYPVAICAGLPKPWAHRDIGPVAVAGSANFDGYVFKLSGAGANIGGRNDECQFAYAPMKGKGTIVARFVPETSSQFSKFGLMMRESPAADAADVSLLVSPQMGRNVEAPGWRVELSVRKITGGDSTLRAASKDFTEPMVTFGRLTGYCWLKLERNGDDFTGWVSSDGKAWTQVGRATAPLARKLLVGLAACSRLAKITTTVRFDHVAVVNPVRVNPDATNQVESPDGKVTVDFSLQSGGIPAYKIDYLGKPIVLESELGLEPLFTGGFRIVSSSLSAHAGSWTNRFGERRIVPDNYHELDVNLRNKSGQLMRVTFRAYDGGTAFRYSFPASAKTEFHFDGERTEFRLPQGTYGYEEHGTEGRYHYVPVTDIQPQCERPLTLVLTNGLFASLTEADNQDYPRMLLSPMPGVPRALVSALGGTTSNTPRFTQSSDPDAILHGGDSTPWRVLVLGQTPGELLERNYLILDLNSPCAIRDTSWIKPGKAMRDTTLTTANCKAIIDFARKAGLKYVELDSGWYGREDSRDGDATTVRAPNLNLPEVIRYGRGKGVGVILYVDYRQMHKQRDILFPLYKKWGIKGVKIGFVAVGSQAATAWVAQTIRLAAKYHLLLDIHDGYRPTGLCRTWPNLLTVEGVRGNEHMPTPEHNCTLPFTRYLAGPADYTICYYTPRKKTTFAHQLAMTVVAFSPLQFIFWYDKPSDYHGEPEIQFFQKVPTVWDDTKVINGQIGKFATIARRSSNDWFVGTINDGTPRTLKVPLAFLAKNRSYEAHIYSDDPSVSARTHVAVTTRRVNSETTLEVPLEAGGGQAMWIQALPKR